jgi:FAD/FMN-containing dehydrogenase
MRLNFCVKFIFFDFVELLNRIQAEILKLCNSYKVPIVAFGSGTSLEGHTLPERGGSLLDSLTSFERHFSH